MTSMLNYDHYRYINLIEVLRLLAYHEVVDLKIILISFIFLYKKHNVIFNIFTNKKSWSYCCIELYIICSRKMAKLAYNFYEIYQKSKGFIFKTKIEYFKLTYTEDKLSVISPKQKTYKWRISSWWIRYV